MAALHLRKCFSKQVGSVFLWTGLKTTSETRVSLLLYFHQDFTLGFSLSHHKSAENIKTLKQSKRTITHFHFCRHPSVPAAKLWRLLMNEYWALSRGWILTLGAFFEGDLTEPRRFAIPRVSKERKQGHAQK